MDDIKRITNCTGFQWDKGNINKNFIRRRVEHWECEQVFFSEPLFVLADVKYSLREKRYAAFGRTNAGRLLAVIFTVRGKLIRVISARDMNRRERKFYEQG